MASWKIEGQYMETCNCTFVCPCITSNLTAQPTDGECKAAVAMQIGSGHKDNVRLDGLSFIVMIHAPKAMAEGNMTVGLIIDERATDEQADAIAAIASGNLGGPLAALGPLIGKMAGVERRPISFRQDGLNYSVTAGELVDQACEGVASAMDPQQPVVLDNVAHPANSRVALAKATKSLFNVFGISWDDSSGKRNAHFAPFSWAG
jgi:hypothetical protein